MSGEQFERAARLIDAADAIVIAAGAGMGVDSGLPDFRGNAGFWRAYPALALDGIGFEQAASASAFRRDPARSWGFYGHRLELYRRVARHSGFALLQRWAQNKPFGASVFTSNVDGQFQRAGLGADRIHECHGSIHQLQCLDDCSGAIWQAGGFLPDVDEVHCRLRGGLPQCPDCGAIARPNILMFDDWHWAEQRARAQRAKQASWLAQVRRPVVIEIGAGTAIPTVRHFSRRVVEQHGGPLIRINARDAAVERAQDVGLEAGALAALTLIGGLLA